MENISFPSTTNVSKSLSGGELITLAKIEQTLRNIFI